MNLLGDSFKRQLQFDGTYSTITVICSKADDISVTEALKIIPEGEKAHQLHDRTGILEAERDGLQVEIDTLKRQISELTEETEQRLTEVECLKSALDDSDDEDHLMLASPRSSRKRPSREAASEARKRLRLQQSSDSEETDST
jgi:hypothetical protein